MDPRSHRIDSQSLVSNAYEMGIKDSYKVIGMRCPDVMRTVAMSSCRGLRVAEDASILFYKCVKAAGDGWMNPFGAQHLAFKRAGMILTPVFDGPDVPEEKKLEQLRRRAVMKSIKDKAEGAVDLLREVTEVTEQEDLKVSEMRLSEELQQRIRTCVGPKLSSKLNFRDPFGVKLAMERSIAGWQRQSAPITEAHKKEAIKLFELLGLSWIQATGEAEQHCAWLCVHGHVDAVLSEDTDVLAYGTPMLLSKIDIVEGTFRCIVMKELLEGMKMKMEEWRDLCIMLKCDYNSRCKGFPPDGRKRRKAVGIGAVGALAMIEKYRRIEEAECAIEDPAPLNYRRCRELLTVPETMELKRRLAKRVRVDELLQFLNEHEVSMADETIKERCMGVPIEVKDEE